MYGDVIRSEHYKLLLVDFIRQQYGIKAISIDPAKRGYFGETWKINAGDRFYFLKLVYSTAHKKVYERSFPIMEHLNNQGISSISKIIKTLSGHLFVDFDSAVLGLFEWIDGENIQNDNTQIAEYEILAKVYKVQTEGIDILKDSFSTASADLFYSMLNRLKDSTHNDIRSVLEKHSEKITQRAERLNLFAERCKLYMDHFYITHGDAGGNIIVNDGKFYMIDWDDPKLAPPERDAWFCINLGQAGIDIFNNILKQNEINYVLRKERLAYYCYHSFFHYLTEYLKTYFEFGSSEVADNLEEYFNCWIEEGIRYADTI